MENYIIYLIYTFTFVVFFWFWGNTLYHIAGEDKLMWFWLCLIIPPLSILYWIVEYR